MIGLDTNFLVALLVSSSAEHEAAKNKMVELSSVALATTSTNVAELLRLITHPKVFPRPLDCVSAITVLSTFIQDFSVMLLEEDVLWWQHLSELARRIPSLRGNDLFDARIALCLRYNGIDCICTRDGGFSRFSFLTVEPF